MTQPPTAAEAPPAREEELSHRQVLVILSGLLLGMLLAALDQTIVSTALVKIVGDLGGLDQISWVVTAYLLASTVVTPIYGKLGDLLGRRPVYIFVIALFLLGSVLCGFAANMTQLIAFRAVQGLGGGGLMVVAMTIVADVVSPRDRGRYQGYFGAVFAISSIAGPLIGGFLTDHASWKWIFWINLPLGLAALAVVVVALRLPKRPRAAVRIDWPGAVLLSGSITCVVLVTSWGGTPDHPWGSPTIIWLSVAAVVLGAAFAAVELRAAEPLLPLRLFRDRTFSLSSGISFVTGFAMFGGISFIPVFLQLVSGASATNSGLLLLPFMAGVLTASMGSGRLITRTGRYKVFPVLGTAIASGGMALLGTMDVGTTKLVSGLYMVVLGVGIGLVMQVTVLAVQNTAPLRDLGVATSTVTFTRFLGASVGVAVFGAIFNNRLAADLAERIPGSAAGAVPSGGRLTREAIDGLPAPLRDGVLSALADSLTTVYLWAVPPLLVSFALALLLREVPLRDHGGLTAPRPAE
ncbi:MDR family MFS transporter [Bailinhaonella thermotolerans]|uniref:DHA2 family efflux MFS transporter permease subunit n=1 Tax=Bailinhaonella thermotolerans TaxID=1070861 RepID=A0A3A4AN24_9ACTN|nr:MDR family MFS transporter [Bailinhaonella thermotolerans]RJL22748.1 DHA2 family efflux MFS transporter permease subunit [Bailinhaonella thermotolerans]